MTASTDNDWRKHGFSLADRLARAAAARARPDESSAIRDPAHSARDVQVGPLARSGADRVSPPIPAAASPSSGLIAPMRMRPVGREPLALQRSDPDRFVIDLPDAPPIALVPPPPAANSARSEPDDPDYACKHNYNEERSAMRLRLRAKPSNAHGSDEPTVYYTCPGCGAKARVDIHDPFRGNLHLSCTSCFKMWQMRVNPTATHDGPVMRD